MNGEFAIHEVMRAIGRMEEQLPGSWSGPGAWADAVQQSAKLIVALEAVLSPVHLAGLMAIGAMAHRQFKAEQARERSSAE